MCGHAGAAAHDSPLTLPQYIAELDRLTGDLALIEQQPQRAAELMSNVPDSWTVTTPDGHTYTVPAAWLKSDLSQPKPGLYRAARNRLTALSREAKGYERDFFSPQVERAKLADILARREFQSVHGPSWLEGFQQYLREIVSRLLRRLFGFSAFPTVSRILAWALIGMAVAALAWFTYRWISRRATLATIPLGILPVSAKAWSIWVEEARAAAERGDWREAVHLAYWGGISFLEAQGSWRPDRARTPREYLLLLPNPSEHRAALLALTRHFEVVWYGYQEAGESAYQLTLAQLEKLGCR
jgi:hypothetical protein